MAEALLGLLPRPRPFRSNAEAPFRSRVDSCGEVHGLLSSLAPSRWSIPGDRSESLALDFLPGGLRAGVSRPALRALLSMSAILRFSRDAGLPCGPIFARSPWTRLALPRAGPLSDPLCFFLPLLFLPGVFF